MTVQLRCWRAALGNGAHRVGWKVGAGEPERLGGLVVGHLTSATRLQVGQPYRSGEGEDLHADAEVAVRVGPEPAFAAALEFCDLCDSDDDAEAIVARNVFHRAFVLGEFAPEPPVSGGLVVNGEVRAQAPIPADLLDRIDAVERILRAVGEKLRAGDIVITGSVVQLPVQPGDRVSADFGWPAAPWAEVTTATAPRRV